MTKIAFIADAHVANHRRWGGPMVGGINTRGWDCVRALQRASREASEMGAETLVVLGDLFDATRPPPPLVAEVARALTSAMRHVIVLLGNHDRQSQHELDHACASLALDHRIQVITEPSVCAIGGVNLVLVPYEPGRASEWLASRIAGLGLQKSSSAHVVCTHVGIWDDSTPGFLRSAHDAIGLGQARWLCDTYGIRGLIAGNWHAQRRWEPTAGWGNPGWVCIPGTACPARFDDPEGDGHVVLYDSVSDRPITTRIRNTPAFYTAASANELTSMVATGLRRQGLTSSHPLMHTYVRVRVPRDALPEAIQRRAQILEDAAATFAQRLIIHVEPKPDDARTSVREAARAVAAAGDDLSGYLELGGWDPVEPGTRGGVLRRLDAYRKAAS